MLKPPKCNFKLFRLHRQNRVGYRGSGRADIHLGYGVTVRPNTLKQTAHGSKTTACKQGGPYVSLRY